MHKDKKILAIIPARGGSKGIPRKNIVEVSGKPLIAWTIDQAKKSKYIDKLILSSEDQEIISVAEKYGCAIPFVRPQELAEDSTPGIDPVIHALEHVTGFDFVLLLQATSPLRSTSDIDDAIELCFNSQAQSLVSVTVASENPYWMYKISNENKLSKAIETEEVYDRRQDLPNFYILNGAIYFSEIDHLLKTRSFIDQNTIAFVMPEERSLDIDTQFDLNYLKFILNSKEQN